MDGEEIRAWTQQARDAWNRKAEFWDDYFGDEGNDFHRMLVAPAVERLLAIREGEQVLDVACGNGVMGRRLAQLGAQVVACDFSQEFLERAKARTTGSPDRIEYRLIDATDEAQLMALGERRFDAAVCTQALMDMATIDPLIAALSRLLKRGGRFVFSLGHPCFNSIGGDKVAEMKDVEGEVTVVYSVKVSGYIRPVSAIGAGVIGEPAPHPYFHRPLSMLFNACFRTDFVLDGLEEPVYPGDESGERWFSWRNFKEIPPVLVARMRLLGDPGT